MCFHAVLIVDLGISYSGFVFIFIYKKRYCGFIRKILLGTKVTNQMNYKKKSCQL